MFQYKYGKEVESAFVVADMLKDLGNSFITFGKIAGRALRRNKG